MLKILGVLVLIIASFLGGVYYQKQDTGELTRLDQIIREISNELEQEKLRNEKLNETLQLVKRQIQADRIAYDSLLEVVESSESERKALREKVEQQQELLRKLRERLEQKTE